MLGTTDNGNVNDIIDKKMEDEFRTEKQIGIKLKEQIREAEEDHKELVHHLRLVGKERDVTFVAKNGNEMTLQKVGMRFANMLRYKDNVIRDNETCAREIDSLAHEDQENLRVIQLLTDDISHIGRDRDRASANYRNLQDQFDQVYYKNEAELRDLGYGYRKSKSIHAAQVMMNLLRKVFMLRIKMNFQIILKD